MTGLCFVDANVFVYARDPRDPGKHLRAKLWCDHLWQTRLGRTSTQVISETYVALTRLGGATPEVIWASVARLLAWRPRSVDEDVLLRAREIERRYRLSWWDSTMIAAAQLQDCRVLLTEDLHDGMAFGTLIVRSPFTLAIEQPTAAYEVRPQLASLHRPRGRPRRTALA
jgi:predicted nucleic acid-binding protein